MTAGGPDGTQPTEPGTVADDASATGPGSASGPAPDDASAVESAEANVDTQVEELTAALQRERAQFANFKRRAESDRASSVTYGKSLLISELLPVLDDLERARAHGDLDAGPLKGVADKITSVLAAQGLESFGVSGEPFDPELHEAVQHEGDGSNPVIDAVYRQGYRFADRTLRTAMVTVTDAVEATSSASPADQTGAAE